MRISEVLDPLYEFTSTPPDRPISKSELDELEKYLDQLYAKHGLDIEFTRHFLDRVNDQRNKKQITTGELFKMFGKAQRDYGSDFSTIRNSEQGVIHDRETDLNGPFVIDFDRRKKQWTLFAKTVMRKSNFKTTSKKYEV